MRELYGERLYSFRGDHLHLPRCVCVVLSAPALVCFERYQGAGKQPGMQEPRVELLTGGMLQVLLCMGTGMR